MLLILQASSYEGRPASEVSISMSIVTWWLNSLTLSPLLSGSSPSLDVESLVTTSLYEGGEDHFSSSSRYSCLELLTFSWIFIWKLSQPLRLADEGNRIKAECCPPGMDLMVPVSPSKWRGHGDLPILILILPLLLSRLSAGSHCRHGQILLHRGSESTGAMGSAEKHYHFNDLIYFRWIEDVTKKW